MGVTAGCATAYVQLQSKLVLSAAACAQHVQPLTKVIRQAAYVEAGVIPEVPGHPGGHQLLKLLA